MRKKRKTIRLTRREGDLENVMKHSHRDNNIIIFSFSFLQSYAAAATDATDCAAEESFVARGLPVGVGTARAGVSVGVAEGWGTAWGKCWGLGAAAGVVGTKAEACLADCKRPECAGGRWGLPGRVFDWAVAGRRVGAGGGEGSCTAVLGPGVLESRDDGGTERSCVAAAAPGPGPCAPCADKPAGWSKAPGMVDVAAQARVEADPWPRLPASATLCPAYGAASFALQCTHHSH